MVGRGANDESTLCPIAFNRMVETYVLHKCHTAIINVAVQIRSIISISISIMPI